MIVPLPLLGTLLVPLRRREEAEDLRTSPPALVPIPLSVEITLSLGLLIPEVVLLAAEAAGVGGRMVFSTEEPPVADLPLPGRVRELDFGKEGGSILVGMVMREPTLSGLKAVGEGDWKPAIFSKLSFCSCER